MGKRKGEEAAADGKAGQSKRLRKLALEEAEKKRLAAAQEAENRRKALKAEEAAAKEAKEKVPKKKKAPSPKLKRRKRKSLWRHPLKKIQFSSPPIPLRDWRRLSMLPFQWLSRKLPFVRQWKRTWRLMPLLLSRKLSLKSPCVHRLLRPL